MKTGLFLFLVTLSLTGPCWALSVRGLVRVQGTSRFLEMEGDPHLYEIKAVTQESARNLERLVDKDTLQGQGEFNNQRFLLQSLDFVGLSHLLGAWHSSRDQSMVTFEDFQTVSISNPQAAGMNRVLTLDYSVAPERGDTWRIFVSGNRGVSIANMQLSPTRITLQFINLETGSFEPPLELVRRGP